MAYGGDLRLSSSVLSLIVNVDQHKTVLSQQSLSLFVADIIMAEDIISCLLSGQADRSRKTKSCTKQQSMKEYL